MNKRFLLFGSDSFEPMGGWYDFLGSFDVRAEALDKCRSIGAQWGTIVDTLNDNYVEEVLMEELFHE